MKPKDTGKQAAVIKEPADSKQIHVIVDGYKIQMNFPINPESSALSDIKRMMVGGVAKT